uniref:Uncharacterized protein n=1 Tax=Anguilla anguilla TaxID=7936 RepID=A0A0E9WJ84_ANGAN
MSLDRRWSVLGLQSWGVRWVFSPPVTLVQFAD